MKSNNKKDIVVYSLYCYPELTGIGKYTGEMSFWLADKGYRVRVITANPFYPKWRVFSSYRKRLWSTEEVNNVRFHRSPIVLFGKNHAVKRMMLELSFLITSSFYWFWLLLTKTPKVVIVISPSLFSGIHAMIFSLFRRPQLVYHIQDLQIEAARRITNFNSRWVLWFSLKIENSILNKADVVSTISSGMARNLLNRPFNHQKIRMMPNWVDVDSIKPFPVTKDRLAKYNLTQDEFVVLYSGNFGAKQGLHFILEAAKILQEQKRIKFLLAGDGLIKNEIIESVKNQGITNVTFRDLVPETELNAFLSIASVHLLPQLHSATDLVLPSKMGPICASGGVMLAQASVGSTLHDIIKENGLGEVCEPENPELLAAKILELVRVDLTDYRTRSRKYAETELSKEKILTRFFDDLQMNGTDSIGPE